MEHCSTRFSVRFVCEFRPSLLCFLFRSERLSMKVAYVPDVGGVDTKMDPGQVSANIFQVCSFQTHTEYHSVHRAHDL